MEGAATTSMIAKFVQALVEVFAGVTTGFAQTFVDGADVLLLTDSGDLTTFASWGIIVLGTGVVLGVGRLIAGRVGRIGR